MEIDEYKMKLAQRIKEMRIEKGMTLQDLADKLDTNHTHIIRMEKGNQDFRISSLLKVAEALGIEIGKLITL